jgi:hypothetical protein
MLRLVTVLISFSVAACTPDVRATKLADIDLSDSSVLTIIREQLNSEERALLSTYVVRHMAGSARFCGQPLVGPDGKEPATIHEALELTRARNLAERSAMAARQAPLVTTPTLVERRARLIGERDHLITRQSMLRLQFGQDARQRPEWQKLEKDLAALDQKLAILGSGGE